MRQNYLPGGKDCHILSKLMESLYHQFNTYQSKFKDDNIKPQYSPSPVQEGIIIGGQAIAAIAMAAGKTPETYSVATESLLNLSENRREEILQQPHITTILKQKDESYKPYGKLYKYQSAIYMKDRLKEIYRDVIQILLKKLRSVYHGKTSSKIKKEAYDPHRIIGLTERVKKLPYHRVNRLFYPVTKRPEYIRVAQNTYSKNQEFGGLEEKLAMHML